MAFDSDWFISVIIAVVLIVALYILYTRYFVSRDRQGLIRASRAALQRTAGEPVLIHGPAGSPGITMPAGGEPVAFHATFIMSSGCSLIGDNNRRPLPSHTSFKVFTTSGDFSVTEAGIPYRVSVLSTLERMKIGADYYAKNYRQTLILDGMPESVFDDMVTFEIGSQALVPLLSITETGRSVTSTIDSRVRTFAQGKDVPTAIEELFRQKIIRPQPGEEITVVEFFIPQGKDVWVFGGFDGAGTVQYGEGGAGLSVSYADPATGGR
jgi:hypothetical protein